MKVINEIFHLMAEDDSNYIVSDSNSQTEVDVIN